MPAVGKLVLLIGPKGKRYLRRVEADTDFHTNKGRIDFQDLEGAEYGAVLTTHLGTNYQVLRPTLYDLVKGVKRETQIIYPKDIGYICMRLGIGPGMRVIESGCGSGSLTVAMSWFMGATGQIYSYERRPEFIRLNRRNLDWAGVGANVEHIERDIAEGFDHTDIDAIFLDVRTPWEYLDQASAALAPGAPIGFLLPTVNQVSDLLAAMETRSYAGIEVIELMLRRYKPVSDRLRPADRMVAHTGFLVFARQQDPLPQAGDAEAEMEIPTDDPDDDSLDS